MSSPWKLPFRNTELYTKRDREESLSPEAQAPAKKIQEDPLEKAIRELRDQQAALFTKVAKIEEQINRRLKAIEEDFREKEDPTPKLEALRNAVVELRDEDIPGITREIEEVNAKIEAGEKKTKEDLQAYLEEKIKAAVEKICAKTLEESPKNADDSAETGIFITGLKKMRETLKMEKNVDPCDIVHAVLEKVGVSAYYTKIAPVFPTNLRRKDADRAFIYFSSPYHRRFAAGELRKALATEKVIGVSIRDVFEKTSLAEARQLVNVGFYLKKGNVIDRFRVVNFRNTPKLLTAKGLSRYAEISSEALKNAVEELAGGV